MTLKKAGLLTILASGATSCLIYLGSKVRHGKRHLLRSLKALRPVSDQVRQVRRDTETGDYVLTLAKDRDFRILQLTDLHIAGSWLTHLADRRAVQAVSRLAHQTKPDFIIITGDLTYATLQSLNTNNLGAMRAVRRMMRKLHIPWAFTYGNHDVDTLTTAGYRKLDSSFRRTDGVLHRPPIPGVSGFGNQVIQVRNADGSLNTALVLMDSHSYIWNGLNREYDKIRDSQVDWYEKKIRDLSSREGRIIPSLMFLHIPPAIYREGWDRYMSGDPGVSHHFGKRRESICCPEHDGKLWESIQSLGSTRGIFCGHDHLNDFSITCDGVRLTYGRSIDYLAYSPHHHSEYRGGTLISLKSDGSFSVFPVPLPRRSAGLGERFR